MIICSGEMILTRLCKSYPLYICTFTAYLYHFMASLAAKELICTFFVLCKKSTLILSVVKKKPALKTKIHKF